MITMMTFSFSNMLLDQAKKKGKMPPWCYSRKELADLEEQQRHEREIAARRPEGLARVGFRDFLQDIKDVTCPQRQRFATGAGAIAPDFADTTKAAAAPAPSCPMGHGVGTAQ